MHRRFHSIHERFLRQIWSNQYLSHTSLRTVDGRAVAVLDPGRLNATSGPDFRRARISIGGVTYAGDVEIHRTVFEWLQHGHQEDPRYNGVVLHVVLEHAAGIADIVAQSGRTIPTLVLADFLPCSIRTVWQHAIMDERSSRTTILPCAASEPVPDEVREPWLHHLATERLELKVRRFQERLFELARNHAGCVRDNGSSGPPLVEGSPDEIPSPAEPSEQDLARRSVWDQVLYEGLLEGLGYDRNRDPFVRLARSVTLQYLSALTPPATTTDAEAALCGCAGILPDPFVMKDETSRAHAAKLVARWDVLRRNFRGELIHPSDWTLFPTRPANTPAMRIKAAAALAIAILHEDLFRTIVQTIKTQTDGRRCRVALEKLLSSRGDPAADTTDPAALGSERTREILINIILPIGFLYARLFLDREVRAGVMRLLGELPAGAENAITRRMAPAMRGSRLPKNAVVHQGMLQLYWYYCLEQRCGDCAIGQKRGLRSEIRSRSEEPVGDVAD